jgi:sigma-54 dependent transcriptional regulator, acetoin dehydrogenase operon transcriptional activator AcoR
MLVRSSQITDTQDKKSRLLEINKFSADRVAEWCLAVLDSMRDAILVINESAIIQYVNPAYTRITGIAENQAVGRKLLEVHPDAELSKVMQTGKPKLSTIKCFDKIDIVSDLIPIVISGTIVGGVTIFRQIEDVDKLSEGIKYYKQIKNQLQTVINHVYRAGYQFKDIVGSSDIMRETIRLAQKIASGDNDILIYGESGTGKEVFAQALNNAGHRSAGPFIPISCAALSPTLIESELYGYEDGAFTGAKKGGKAGLFEIADGGTIFLDEIGELPLELQSKLLRTLQERKIRRIGSNRESSINVRVIAATHCDLKSMIKKGKFREDLYYRLNVMSIHLPPLRDRVADIREIAVFYLEKIAAKMHKSMEFSPKVYELFYRYQWPGNIRELINTIEYAANISDSPVIGVHNLPRGLSSDPLLTETEANTLAEILHDTELRVIEGKLKSHGFSLDAKKKIANELGISLASLYNKMKSIGTRSPKQ